MIKKTTISTIMVIKAIPNTPIFPSLSSVIISIFSCLDPYKKTSHYVDIVNIELQISVRTLIASIFPFKVTLFTLTYSSLLK